MTVNTSEPTKIIETHVLWAMGIGLVPIPGVDFMGVTYVQLDMLNQLSRYYYIDYNEAQGKAMITSIIGASATRIAASLVKIIPGVGTLVGAGASVVINGASTYAIGTIFKEHFVSGGTFDSVNVEMFRRKFKVAFKEGKEVATDLHKKNQQSKADELYKQRKQSEQDEQTALNKKAQAAQSMDDKIEQLQKMAQMRDKGMLTELEFQKMKDKLFND